MDPKRRVLLKGYHGLAAGSGRIPGRRTAHSPCSWEMRWSRGGISSWPTRSSSPCWTCSARRNLQIPWPCTGRGDRQNQKRGPVCEPRRFTAFMTMFEEQNLLRAAELLYLSPPPRAPACGPWRTSWASSCLSDKKGRQSLCPHPKGGGIFPGSPPRCSLPLERGGPAEPPPRLPHLSVATVDSFLDYNLTPLYRDLVSRHGFSLDIKCYPADMIYSLVSQKQADVGLPSTRPACPT